MPSSITLVVALFERRREALRFPNIDAESLRAQLERVERLRVEAVEALARWESARVASEQSESELHEMSKRAVAYARVFATDDPTLASELDAILNTEPERGKRKKRDAVASATDAEARPEQPRTKRARATAPSVESEAKPSAEPADATAN
ncbi:MAG TPA: hypothetical protein VHM70_05865 [Polyangiaceae bacterium]|jgi:hypothetical protein|nr:hypothetical protein [Polyangiaceae bacterium]